MILNAAEEYQSVIGQLSSITGEETKETRDQRLNASLTKELTGVNLAMIEITLEDVGLEVRTLFGELRLAFNTYILSLDANSQVHGTYTLKELNNEKDIILNKVKELTATMQNHLRELES